MRAEIEGWGDEEPGSEKVTGGFILQKREKIKGCEVDLPLEPISFDWAELVAGFKSQAV